MFQRTNPINIWQSLPLQTVNGICHISSAHDVGIASNLLDHYVQVKFDEEANLITKIIHQSPQFQHNDVQYIYWSVKGNKKK